MTIQVKLSLALPCATLAALGLTACGNSSVSTAFKGEAHEVAQAVANFQTDARNGDEQKICARDLASAVVTRLGSASGGCRAAIKSQLAEADSYEATVQSVQVNAAGARRTASARVKSVHSGKTRPSTLTLVKEAGRWRISGAQ
jgi:hypothetical protein